MSDKETEAAFAETEAKVEQAYRQAVDELKAKVEKAKAKARSGIKA